MKTIRDRLLNDFQNAEYAHEYMASHTVHTIAAQVYWTRKQRKWTQDDLAERSGIAQARISKIEAGEFTSLTMSTLSKLAKALDINLRIEFERFSGGIQRVCSQSKTKLELPSRTADLRAAQAEFTVVTQLFQAMTCDIDSGASITTGQTSTVFGPDSRAQVIGGSMTPNWST